ncbi:hypothetical protein DW322_08545 [Rhodococcus rhodnii]|uniref:Uncharacterized protein n=2 Tax=Rhodococcus rhodnii TaxID=38312 RepID=R7WIC9_9NOCA|nr:hypothetical protein [Rhodococcus rhodnii]EOM74972.1 hypothetical protein Rrhod_3692 [Rhodococcus rhodnii LMG 5362]TXG90262.1 hypothetical protein DW322_08545 [Rhodococcus rhodnii]
MIDAQTMATPAHSSDTDLDRIRTVRRWSPGQCVWCGGDEDVDLYRNEPRCSPCRDKEEIIDEARKFVGMYGLRPLGGTLQSDDDEEYEHRLAARDARRELGEIRLPELPDPAAVRKALRPRAAGVVERAETAAAPSSDAPAQPARKSETRTSPRASSPRTTTARAAASTTVDVAQLEERVTGLLGQLDAVDAQIARIGEPNGLAAKARLKNLENQKATVLRTLAALEKARIAAAR